MASVRRWIGMPSVHIHAFMARSYFRTSFIRILCSLTTQGICRSFGVVANVVDVCSVVIKL